jgi:alpha-glucosidase
MNLPRPTHKFSTASENVFILAEDFWMPQFEQKRRIWIYLPPDYNHNNEKKYPVLYMQDGQNLFDNATAFAGEWAVDNTMDEMFHKQETQGAIIVGIDNGSDTRTYEYSPYSNAKYGGGGGKLYLKFITEILKPYIDSHYRTKTEREFTGIMGSSLGGLISFYGGIAFDKYFGRIGVLSPSFWFSPKIYQIAKKYKVKNENTKLYFLVGGQESKYLVEQTQEMYQIMLEAGLKENEHLKFIVHHEGQHAEWFWKREFAAAYKYLFD